MASLELEKILKDAEVKIVEEFEDMSFSEYSECLPEIVIDAKLERALEDAIENGEKDLSDKEYYSVLEALKEEIVNRIDLSEIESKLTEDDYTKDVLSALGLSQSDFLL